MKNIESDRLGMIRDKEPSFWIRGAFIWSNTKQGSNYWNDLANQWERYLKSLVVEAELKVKQKYGTFDALAIDWETNQED